MSSRQRLTEWVNLSEPDRAYHERQWSEPYRSTVRFTEMLQRLETVRAGDAVYDLGCGAGAATAYLAAQFPQASWTGIEVNEELAQMGRARGVSILHRDIFGGASLRANGWTALGFISWLPNAEGFLELAGRDRPRWIGLSSLFHRDVTAFIEVVNPDGQRKPYNIYSLQRFRGTAEQCGYKVSHVERFEIDIDLEGPEAGMGTRTERLADGRRLMISGPVLMLWHFVVLTRTD